MKFSKNMPLNWYSSMKKKSKDSDNFCRRKLTLKVRNRQFSIAWFRANVDLKKKLYYVKVLFITHLSSHLICKLLKSIKCYLWFSDCNFLANLSFTRPRVSPIFFTRLHETTRPGSFFLYFNMAIYITCSWHQKTKLWILQFTNSWIWCAAKRLLKALKRKARFKMFF